MNTKHVKMWATAGLMVGTVLVLVSGAREYGAALWIVGFVAFVVARLNE